MKKPTMRPKDILALRQTLRLTQEELGRKLGVTQYTVCRWEKGVHPINLKNLRKLERLAALPRAGDSMAVAMRLQQAYTSKR